MCESIYPENQYPAEDLPDFGILSTDDYMHAIEECRKAPPQEAKELERAVRKDYSDKFSAFIASIPLRNYKPEK